MGGASVFLIKPRRSFKVPVEAECISPDKFAGLNLEDLKKLKVFEGNRTYRLEELFYIKAVSKNSPSASVKIIMEGNFSKVWRIGEEMSTGEIVIKGNVGPFLGFRMRGGVIIVHGHAGPWLGAEMRDGIIEVHGCAGDHVGAVLRGERSLKGMSGGIIRVHGYAGAEVGACMNGGLIAIDGSCKAMPGVKMSGGSILIRGDCEGKAGARMTGGKIVVCGRVGEVLPTFYIDGIASSVKVKGEKIKGPFYLFLGDVLGDIECRGRLYVSVKNNPDFKVFESLLETMSDDC